MARSSNTPARPDAARRPADADRATELLRDGHADASRAECTERARAEQNPAQPTTDCAIFRAAQTRRTDESLRAETAFRDWSKADESERPLIVHRETHLRVLRGWRDAHGVSKCRLADWLGVHEKQVRKMLKKEAVIPGEVVFCIPRGQGLRADYLKRLGEEGGDRPVETLDAQIAKLDMAGAIAANRQVMDRIAQLATEGR